MGSPIDLVAFDLGGVLVDVDKSKLVSHLGISKQLAEKAFFKDTLFESFVLGEMTSVRYFSEVSHSLGLSPTRVEDAFKQIVQPRAFCNDLLLRLRSPFTIWSNINVCHYEHIVDRVSLLKNGLRKGGLSFEMGVSKPKIRFFEHCLLQLGREPSSILFLDNVLENVVAAKKLGIQARLVHREAEIISALTSSDLLG